MLTVASAPNLRSELQARLLGCPDADHASRTHLLCRGDRKDADRAGALDHDRVAPAEAAGANGAVDRADAGGQRLRQRAEPERHVIGQLVDLGAGQHLEIDIDILRPAAPEMGRLVEAEIASVIDGCQALVGGLRVMQAPVTGAAGHQRRDHDARADLERLAHEVGGEVRAFLDDDAADLVTEREGPGEGLRPVAFQDVLVGAADAAGADLDQRRLARHVRPGNAFDLRLGTGAGEGRDTDVWLGHGFVSSWCFFVVGSLPLRSSPRSFRGLEGSRRQW